MVEFEAPTKSGSALNQLMRNPSEINRLSRLSKGRAAESAWPNIAHQVERVLISASTREDSGGTVKGYSLLNTVSLPQWSQPSYCQEA